MVAVKTYDMAASLGPMHNLNVATVLSVQNSVLKNEQLANALGSEKTVGAATFFGVEVVSEGSVRFTFNQGFYVGELLEGTSERVQQLVEALARADIQAEATAHIQTIEWSKFVAWVGSMVLSILTRLQMYKFLSDPDTALVAARLMRETAGLATKQGIALEDIPPVPMKTLSSLVEAEAVEKLRELEAMMQARAPMHRMSSVQDLEHGRRLEVEETLGNVIQSRDSEPRCANCAYVLPTH